MGLGFCLVPVMKGGSHAMMYRINLHTPVNRVHPKESLLGTVFSVTYAPHSLVLKLKSWED